MFYYSYMKEIRGKCFPWNIHEGVSPHTENLIRVKSIWFCRWNCKINITFRILTLSGLIVSHSGMKGGNGSTQWTDDTAKASMACARNMSVIYLRYTVPPTICEVLNLIYLDSTPHQWKHSLGYLGSKSWNMLTVELIKTSLNPVLQKAGPY